MKPIKTQKEFIERYRAACGGSMRRQARIDESVKLNPDPDVPCIMQYTARVQVRVWRMWVTVWSETCSETDSVQKGYVRRCAEEALEKLTAKI